MGLTSELKLPTAENESSKRFEQAEHSKPA